MVRRWGGAVSDMRRRAWPAGCARACGASGAGMPLEPINRQQGRAGPLTKCCHTPRDGRRAVAPPYEPHTRRDGFGTAIAPAKSATALAKLRANALAGRCPGQFSAGSRLKARMGWDAEHTEEQMRRAGASTTMGSGQTSSTGKQSGRGHGTRKQSVLALQ